MAAAAAVAGGEERNGGKRWALEVRRWGRGFAFVFGCKNFLEVLCLLLSFFNFNKKWIHLNSDVSDLPEVICPCTGQRGTVDPFLFFRLDSIYNLIKVYV